MRAITHLEHVNPDDWDHIICPVSGGKDSQMMLALAVDTPGVREKLKAVHQFTGYDHSLTHEHLHYMEERYGVKILTTRNPKYADLFDFIRKERYFPSSLARSCTSRLKIKPFNDWLLTRRFAGRRTLVLLGMRGAESQSRAQSYGDLSPADLFSICDISKDYSRKLLPVQVQLSIVDVTTGDVFEWLAARGDKINPLYAKGHSRVGCYPCLLAGDKEWALAALDPEGQEHIRKLIEIEDSFLNDPNFKRKLILIHPTRDVRGLLERKKCDPFGFSDEDSGCGTCNY